MNWIDEREQKPQGSQAVIAAYQNEYGHVTWAPAIFTPPREATSSDLDFLPSGGWYRWEERSSSYYPYYVKTFYRIKSVICWAAVDLPPVVKNYK